MQGHGHPGRAETYARALDTFARSTRLGSINRERVEIPLAGGGTMPALWTRAPGDGPRPAVVFSVRVAGDGAVSLDGAERALIRSRAKLAYDTVRDADLPAGFADLAAHRQPLS